MQSEALFEAALGVSSPWYVRAPRVKLPDGAVRLIKPPWAGKLSGFTLLFEALVLSLCREMPFAAVARLVGESWHRVAAIAERRAVIFVTETRETAAIERLAEDLRAHGGDPQVIHAVSIDMSPAYIKGVVKHLPNATVTFDKFHVIAHASHALDLTRRADLDALLAHLTTKRTARAWQYREDLREILGRKQINVVREMLRQWCTNVMRSKVEPMKAVAKMIRAHLEGVVAWAITRG
jgi:hypothetical protein